MNQITINGVMFCSLLLLTNCTGTSNESPEVTPNIVGAATSVDTSESAETIVSKADNTASEQISCHIFFKGFDIPDEETGETSKGSVDERTQFNEKKAYTFCFDSESFHHLTVKGKGDNISITVLQGSKPIYKKNQINLNGEFTLSSKDFDFGMNEEYLISVMRQETEVFKGTIASQGCM